MAEREHSSENTVEPISLTINGKVRLVGPGQPTFVVAEVSCNHLQQYDRAVEIIDRAIEAGADAIKLQTNSPDELTIDSDKHWFQITEGTWKGQTLYDLYKKVYTPWEWQPKLKKYAEDKGVLLFSTPVAPSGVDLLETIDVQLYKVASFESIDKDLLERIGRTRKPVIVSRGMASEAEIRQALKFLRDAGAPQVAVLHCVSEYPADPKDMNLATIPDIAKRFKVVSGLSDHTLGIETSIAAVALGASIIEKHVTLRRADGGADATFSLEPEELKQLVHAVRIVEQAVGKPTYTVSKIEEQNIVFRRSLFVAEDIGAGEKFTPLNVRSVRPGYGIAPKNLGKVLGKTAAKKVEKGTPFTWDLVKKSGKRV